MCISPELLKLLREFVLREAPELDILLKFVRICFYRLRFSEPYIIRPPEPLYSSKVLLYSHVEAVVPQPEAVFFTEIRILLILHVAAV